MLTLKNICKNYKYGKNTKKVLDKVNISFKNKEMVFILGSSGSGKSTLLNIIAGNLKSDSGEIYFKDECINKKKDSDLCEYRNKVIGYIYQDYNLIDHMNVYDNIVIGCNDRVDRKKISELLKKLDIEDKKYIKVSKLSGGEKQRVAIARALINDPEIILADEPTGALDSHNGIKIMEILKEISQDKLVIVVSHDKYLASKYGNRIINIKDGQVSGDTFVLLDDLVNQTNKKEKRKKIKSFRIRKLAFKNLWLKKGRSIVTMVAISLGIVSMMMVLCIANNFNKEIDNLEEEVVSVFPIVISNQEYDEKIDDLSYERNDIVYAKKNDKYKNKITEEYLNYLNELNISKELVYDYDKIIPFISDRYEYISDNDLKIIPNDNYILDNYEIIYGKMIENKYQILLKIDNDNTINSDIKNYFNFDSEISYSDIIGRKIRIIINDLYYQKNGDYYFVNYDYEKIYKESEIELEIVGIVKEKEDNLGGSFIYYDGDIIEDVIEINKESEIINNQLISDYNVLGLDISKEEMLSYLGYDKLPSTIYIYVNTISEKEEIKKQLDNYNIEHDKIIYEDIMASNIKIVKDFTMIISIVLVLFSIISIIISLLMIGILTSIRVLERKKEIGIIRSLGASRKDIRKLFNTENMLIGLVSSLIGLLILRLLLEPVNKIIYNVVGLEEILRIDIVIALIVIIFNIFIIRLAGSIPSRKASKLEITNCIYDR